MKGKTIQETSIVVSYAVMPSDAIRKAMFMVVSS